MSKLRTFDDLSDAVTRDFNWRLQEISDIKLSIRQTDKSAQRSLLRTSIPMLYAHWEGHVSFSSKAYVTYICSRRPKYEELKVPFSVNTVMGYFNVLAARNLSLTEKIEFMQKISNSKIERMVKIDDRLMSTQSNLSSKTLSEICLLLSFDSDKFATYFDFIDKILLDRRNNIAHGQYIVIDELEFTAISDKVLELMRLFRNTIENSAVTSDFLA